MKKTENKKNKPKNGQEKAKINRFRAILYNIFPSLVGRLYTKDLGGTQAEFDGISSLFWKKFSESRRIDIFPRAGTAGRGLIIVIDNKIHLDFTQDHDHFELANFGFGEYNDKCDPTEFDHFVRGKMNLIKA